MNNAIILPAFMLWYSAVAMVVMATLYGVYMELTRQEKEAIQLVQQLREHVAALERANQILTQGIQETIKPPSMPKESPIEAAFNRRKEDK